jgi:heptosyltransferase III
VRRLLIRPGGIGDTILSFPAMECLRAGYTEVWVRSEIVPLIRFADRVRSIASTGIDLLGLEGVEPPAELVRGLGSFDEIVTWYGANRPEFQSALGSFCKNARYLKALPPATGVHAADFFLEQAGLEQAGPERAGVHGPAVPRIDVGEVERRPSIVFHPFSGSDRKNWPLARFEELARELACVEWAARPDWVAGRFAPRPQARFENLLDLARWIAGARLYIGNDSGITHLAAAAGARTIALFGPTDPEAWGPRGTGVTILRAPSMHEISMAMVRDAIAAALAASPPARNRQPGRGAR